MHDLITDQLLLFHLILRTQELLFRNQLSKELLIQVSMKAACSLVKLNTFLVQAENNQSVIHPRCFRPLSKVLPYISQGLWELDSLCLMQYLIAVNVHPSRVSSSHCDDHNIYLKVKYTYVKIQLMCYFSKLVLVSHLKLGQRLPFKGQLR